MQNKDQVNDRFEIIDWLKAWAIFAVILDHLKIVPEHYVVWSVNIFVLVTAAVYSIPGYVFTLKKLAIKYLYLAYLYITTILLMDFILGMIHAQNNRAVLSVLLNPFFIFVKNPYLGDIWYLGLHVQILAVFYLFLKYKDGTRAGYVFLIAALISQTSFLITHFYLNRFHTIFVASWLFFLAMGFYGMRPLITMIRTSERYRFLRLLAAAGVLVLFYSCYPFVPWIFQNENRSSFLTPPLYFGLIFFLAELFYLVGRFSLGNAVRQGMSFIGRHTLAIYLTHEAFAAIWSKVFTWPLALAILALGSGILFGMITDRLFSFLKTNSRKILIRTGWV